MRNRTSLTWRQVIAGSLIALGLAAALANMGKAQTAKADTPSSADWREQNAYTLGVQAYLYAFPWAYMPEARWLRTEALDRQADRFDHIRHLEDANHLSGGAPNNDTLYSRAWVYLKDEPVILTVPEIADRYYTMEITDFMGDNFAYVGTRATGNQGGKLRDRGSRLEGNAARGRNGAAAVLDALGDNSGPHLCEGCVRSGRRAQDPRSVQARAAFAMGQAGSRPPKDAVIWEGFDPKTDPLADWKTINRAMIEVPPPVRDADMLQQFARIGIGPGLDVEAQDESMKRGLARAAVDGKKIIADAFTDGYLQKVVNGWNYPPPATGRPSPSRDWIFRAVQMLAGFIANDPVEGTYLNVSVDGDGKPLTGKNRYVIHFDKGGEPKVKAFWSVTMYNPQYNLVANPIDRYSLGDRSGMKHDADGGLTIYVQKDSPGADKESNWLPAPDRQFFMIMRTYLPADDIVNQTWQPPKIAAVN